MEWQRNDETIAFFRVGFGVSLAFAGKIFQRPTAVWTIDGPSGSSSFDIKGAICRADDMAVPKALQDLMVSETAPGLELLLETGERCFLWKVRRPS
jgi:hypothetical protein